MIRTLALSPFICLGLLGSPAAARERPAVPVSTEVLDQFRDCSIRLWYDPIRRELVGTRPPLAVPRRAVLGMHDGHASLAITGSLHGIPVTELFLPAQPPRASGSDQISARLSSGIERARARLDAAWHLGFVSGVPEGPDIDPAEVAYYARDAAYKPYLHAISARSRVTTVFCVTRHP